MAYAAEINPTDLNILRNLGTAYLQLGRVDDATKAFKAIIVLNDHCSAARNGRGLVAIQRNDAQTARHDFEKAVQSGPDEAEPLLNPGVLYQKAGRCPEAVRCLRSFLLKASQSFALRQPRLGEDRVSEGQCRPQLARRARLRLAW